MRKTSTLVATGCLVAATLTVSMRTTAGTYPTKQSNCGDSISQGFDANATPWDHPQYSWVQGTDSSVDSVYTRYSKLVPGFTQQPESVTGAQMVNGGDSFAAQAQRICSQSVIPQHVSVFLGSNDVCDAAASTSSDPTANMLTPETFVAGFDAGMEELNGCLPDGASIQVISMPRVDQLYVAGNEKSGWCSWTWSIFDICRIVTGEKNDARRAEIGSMVDTYNQAIADEVARLRGPANNPHHFTMTDDWKGSISQGHTDTSVGTHLFNGSEINIVDCFHPNEIGQAELACNAWVNNPDGSGVEKSCFTQEGN